MSECLATSTPVYTSGKLTCCVVHIFYFFSPVFVVKHRYWQTQNWQSSKWASVWRHQRPWTLYSRSDLVLSYSVNWTLCGTFLIVWKWRNWLQAICKSCSKSKYVIVVGVWNIQEAGLNVVIKYQILMEICICLQINHGGRHGHRAGRSFCGTRTEDSEWILRYPGQLISSTPISFSKPPTIQIMGNNFPSLTFLF